MKKILIIAIVSIIAIIIVKKIIGPPPPPERVWSKNRISASFEPSTINEKVGEKPATAELYIDASGSMKPYFRADGTAMINTLSEFVNLNTAGTSVYFLDNPRKYNGLIKNIVQNINQQPNNSNTLFHDFFKNAACKIDTTSTIIYLVTDGIMSIHDTNSDMSAALVQLRGKIQHSLAEHPNLAGAIFRYVGGYRGMYWNSRSKAINLNNQIDRPYYIIALGQKETMRWLESVPVAKLNNPHRLFMGIHDLAGHKKAVLALGNAAKIEDINKEITLILDLPPCLQNMDITNAKLTNNGREINVRIEKEGARLIAKIPPTIGLMPERDGSVKVRLSVPNKVPNQWIIDWNCDNDIAGPDTETTFGLGTLVRGMFEGLEMDSDFLSVDFIYKRQ